MRKVIGAVVLSGLCLTACQSSSAVPKTATKGAASDVTKEVTPVTPHAENSKPTRPDIELITMSDLQDPSQATLFVHFKTESTDADHDPVSYRFAWFRNGVAWEYPAGQTNAVLAWTDVDVLRYLDAHRMEQWTVVVTPLDGYAEGATAFAGVTVDLIHGCKIDPDSFDFSDCGSLNPYPITSTGDWVPGASASGFIETLLTGNLTFSSANGAYWRFLNFANLVVMRNLDATPDTDPDHNPETYLYRPTTAPTGPFTGSDATIGAGGYDPEVLLSQCIDVPLVGTVCIRGQVFDNDFEIGQRILKFQPENVSILTTDVRAQPDGTTTYAVSVSITSSTFDMLAEPPTDSTLVDISNSSPNYLPENDLSTYLKAHGRATANYVLLTLTGSLPAVQAPAGHSFELVLRSVKVGSVTLVTEKGPYCNNNLGTTETPFAGTTNTQVLPTERPFRSTGAATSVSNYPGLISDVIAGQGGSYANVRRGGSAGPAGTYRPLSLTAPYNVFPRTMSSAAGGTGAGRDRIGVNTSPYQYHDVAGTSNDRFSDNPNNCRRPADTCTLTVANGGIDLDGSTQWTGTSPACEGSSTLDPVSNNSDDASYKISELILSSYPTLMLR